MYKCDIKCIEPSTQGQRTILHLVAALRQKIAFSPINLSIPCTPVYCNKQTCPTGVR